MQVNINFVCNYGSIMEIWKSGRDRSFEEREEVEWEGNARTRKVLVGKWQIFKRKRRTGNMVILDIFFDCICDTRRVFVSKIIWN